MTRALTVGSGARVEMLSFDVDQWMVDYLKSVHTRLTDGAALEEEVPLLEKEFAETFSAFYALHADRIQDEVQNLEMLNPRGAALLCEELFYPTNTWNDSEYMEWKYYTPKSLVDLLNAHPKIREELKDIQYLEFVERGGWTSSDLCW